LTHCPPMLRQLNVQISVVGAVGSNTAFPVHVCAFALPRRAIQRMATIQASCAFVAAAHTRPPPATNCPGDEGACGGEERCGARCKIMSRT